MFFFPHKNEIIFYVNEENDILGDMFGLLITYSRIHVYIYFSTAIK